jgi:hypothetical protein
MSLLVACNGWFLFVSSKQPVYLATQNAACTYSCLHRLLWAGRKRSGYHSTAPKEPYRNFALSAFSTS